MATEATPRKKSSATRRSRHCGGSDHEVAPAKSAVAKDKLLSPLMDSSLDESQGYDEVLVSAPSKEEKARTVTPCLPEERRRQVKRQCHKVQSTVPGAQRMMGLLNLCPPRVRVAILSLWVAWKVVLVVMILHAAFFTTSFLADSSSSQDNGSDVRELGQYTNDGPPRILYIVTTLSEFNTGKRQTEKGQDRLGEVLIPVLVDSVESMVHEPFKFHVDVFLISAFKLKPDREAHIRERLPEGVGLQVWDDACPLGYEAKHSDDKVIDNTRALARQHRYVIKDKLPYYDLFVAFEDDMRVTADHASHFLKMSAEIEKLRLEAPETIPNQPPVKIHPKEQSYYGPLTRGQLDRIIPGFIRVEVLIDEKEHGAQTTLANIDPDFMFDVSDEAGKLTQKEFHFNPRICCHVQMKPNKNTPVHPYPKDVVIWETNIKALSARKLPQPKVGNPSPMVDWVGLLPGPGKRLDQKFLLGGYWSGREGAFGDEEKPSGGRPDIIAQQGGWMLTRKQVLRMNNDNLCMGNLVPPFDEPMYRHDGQESFNVEFWSGGYQLFTGVRGGCNMQRVISLNPEYLSNHFIYHTANNKQKQLNSERMLRADNLFAQLNTVRKAAEKAMVKDLGAAKH